MLELMALLYYGLPLDGWLLQNIRSGRAYQILHEIAYNAKPYFKSAMDFIYFRILFICFISKIQQHHSFNKIAKILFFSFALLVNLSKFLSSYEGYIQEEMYFVV